MDKRKPKQKRSLEKVDAIIRSASRIISEDGALDASTHTIAKRAGVGVGTVYDYFEGKEDILLAVLDHELRSEWATVEARVPEWLRMDRQDALREFVELIVALAMEHRGLVNVMVTQLPDVMAKESVVRILSQGELLVKLLLAAEGDGGDGREAEARTFLLINALVGVVLGIARGLPATVDERVLADEIARSLALVLDNLDEFG